MRRDLSRRHLLVCLAAGAATGCVGDGAGVSEEDGGGERQDLRNVDDDPSFARVRHPEGGVAVRSSRVEPDEEAGWTPTHWLVNSAKDRFLTTISSETNGGEDARELLEGTDLSSEAVLVQQYSVEECLTRRPDTVRWDETGVDVEYVAEDRTDCEIDVFDTEAVFVRIPGDVRELGYFGSSVRQA